MFLFNCSKTYATAADSPSMAQLAAAAFVQAAACCVLQKHQEPLNTLHNTFYGKQSLFFCISQVKLEVDKQ